MIALRWFSGEAFHHFALWAMLYARVAPTFLLTPVLSSTMVANKITRQILILFLVMGASARVPFTINGPVGWTLAHACLMEAITGLGIGILLATPFWVASTVGELIDNQRGATIADSIDPASGVEASVLSPFLNLMFTNVFLQKGGLIVLIGFFADSVRDIPLGTSAHLNFSNMAGLLNHVLQVSLSLSAPVVISLLLTDGCLALLSRFCKQLNAFSLSLTVKSLAAYAVMFFYFSSTVPMRIYDMTGSLSLKGILQ